MILLEEIWYWPSQVFHESKSNWYQIVGLPSTGPPTMSDLNGLKLSLHVAIDLAAYFEEQNHWHIENSYQNMCGSESSQTWGYPIST